MRHDCRLYSKERIRPLIRIGQDRGSARLAAVVVFAAQDRVGIEDDR